jgi:WD40 repeat protein
MPIGGGLGSSAASAVRGIAFSPDGHTLASTGDDNSIMIWE